MCEGNSFNDDIIIGVGINVDSSPIEGSCAVGGDAEVLFQRLLKSFEEVYTLLEKQPDAVLACYRERLATKDVTVKVSVSSKEVIGTALGIDDEGRLLVRDNGEIYAVNSGEATIIKDKTQ